MAANSTAASSFTIEDGYNFTTSGNFTNNGTLVIGSDSTFAVATGSSLTNFSGTTLTGGTYNITGTLQFPDANIVTNAANITLTGSGTILDQSSNNGLRGFDTNSSSGSFTINSGANFNAPANFSNAGAVTVGSGSTFGLGGFTYTNTGTTTVQAGGTMDPGTIVNTTGTFTNQGTLEASAGGTLTLQGGTFTNTGGTILATGTGSQVVLNGATITGGTLTSSSSGVIVGENNAVLNGSSGALTISTGSTLQVNNGQTLDVEGTITNNGALNLNSSGSTTELLILAKTTLSGTGMLTLSNNASNLISGAAISDTLTNQEVIQGAGNIGNGQMTLVNSGTINANQSAGLTVQANGGATNMGTVEATAGATLSLAGTPTVTNTGTLEAKGGSSLVLSGGSYANAGGTILATGSGAQVVLNGATITGGTLTSNSGGVIVGQNSALLDGTSGALTISTGSTLQVNNGQTLDAQGTITNNGALTLNSSGSTTDLLILANTTLGGTGTLTLSNNANNVVQGAATADTLTNKETIQGAGNIGNGQMTLVNSGTITANQSTALLIDTSGSFTNNGKLVVNSGDLLHVLGGSFKNFSGSTLTGGTYNTSGTLEIDQLGSSGGEIVTNAASIILNGAASSLVDAAGKNALATFGTNAAKGSFSLQGGRNFTTAGSFANNGALSVGNGSTFVFGGATLTNTGTLSLSGTALVDGSGATQTLTNSGTIAGSGTVGDAVMGLVNSGTMNANQSASLTIQTNGGDTNTGTLEDTGGSSLVLNGGNYANAGGTIKATGAGSVVTLENGVTVAGGTLATSGGGVIETPGTGTNATLDGSTKTVTNSGSYQVSNGDITYLKGTINNTGSITLNSTGEPDGTGGKRGERNPDRRRHGNDVEQHRNKIVEAASGDTLTNQETIQGAGTIGNGALTLVNSGTINANQSTALLVDTGSFTNTGKLVVNSGDLMHVFGGAFTNFSGSTLTAAPTT